MALRPEDSPPRFAPLTRQLSGLGAKLGNVFGGGARDDSASIAMSDSETLAGETDQQSKRSVSRGRDAFQKSTGRGGAGNIRASPNVGEPGETDSLSPVRGREIDNRQDKIQSVGRGGVGNIRSRSRSRAASQIPDGFPQTQSLVSEHQAATAAHERRVIEDAAKGNVVHSSGRGGAGNISNSRSRSRGPTNFFGSSISAPIPPDSPRHSTGRGGMGNSQPGAEGVDVLDEAEAWRVTHDPDGMHSTGRGGAANLTDVHTPPPELHPHQQLDFESSGRGGAGNIRSRSTSRDSPRSASRDRLSRIWQKVTHPGMAHDIMEEHEGHASGEPGSNGGNGGQGQGGRDRDE